MEFGMLHWSIKIAIFCGACLACFLFMSIAESKSEQMKNVGKKLLNFIFEMLEDAIVIILAILS